MGSPAAEPVVPSNSWTDRVAGLPGVAGPGGTSTTARFERNAASSLRPMTVAEPAGASAAAPAPVKRPKLPPTAPFGFGVEVLEPAKTSAASATSSKVTRSVPARSGPLGGRGAPQARSAARTSGSLSSRPAPSVVPSPRGGAPGVPGAGK